MTQQIKDLGGLPEGEIHLAIARSEEKTGNLLETKLRQHQEAMEKRLTAQDEAIQENLDKIIDVKTDVATLLASDKQQTQLLERIATVNDVMHKEQIDFRQDVIGRVAVIEAEQKRLSSQMRLIRWIVAASAAIVRALAFSLKVISTEEFWKVAGVAIALWFLHFASPYLANLINQILK